MVKKLLVFFIGVMILGFGIVLNTKTGLGVAAINSLPFGISQLTPLTLGMATTILYIIFVIMEVIIYRKINLKIILQIPFSSLMGFVLDFYDNLLKINSLTWPLALALLVIAILTTALGAYLLVTMDVVLNPADGIVKAISQKIDKEFGKTKLFFDCGMITLTCIITYLFSRTIIGIGIGTIVSAIMIGQIIVFYNHRFTNYLNNLVGK